MVRGTLRSVLLLAWAVPLLLVPAYALVDLGPTSTPRASAFPVALTAFDPFVATCLAASSALAAGVTAASLALGVPIGWALARWRLLGGRAILAALAVSAAIPPACAAIGLRELTPLLGRLPISPAALDVALLAWAELASGLGWIVAATAWALRAVDPSWEDGALLAGATRREAAFGLIVPLIGPAIARAAALLFIRVLFDPGGPMVLGARRNLAFQVVDQATSPDGLSRAATLATLGMFVGLAVLLVSRLGGRRPVGPSGVGRGRLRPLKWWAVPLGWGVGLAALAVAVGPLAGVVGIPGDVAAIAALPGRARVALSSLALQGWMLRTTAVGAMAATLAVALAGLARRLGLTGLPGPPTLELARDAIPPSLHAALALIPLTLLALVPAGSIATTWDVPLVLSLLGFVGAIVLVAMPGLLKAGMRAVPIEQEGGDDVRRRVDRLTPWLAVFALAWVAAGPAAVFGAGVGVAYLVGTPWDAANRARAAVIVLVACAAGARGAWAGRGE